jgi:hypothetical protein
MSGQYQAIEPNENGWLWSQQLGLYLGIDHDQLRFFTPQGKLVLTPEETAEKLQQRAELLAEKLQELGINPDDIE